MGIVEIFELRDPWGGLYYSSLEDLLAGERPGKGWATPTQIIRQRGSGGETCAALGEVNRFEAYLKLRRLGATHEEAEECFNILGQRESNILAIAKEFLNSDEGIDFVISQGTPLGGAGGTPFDSTRAYKEYVWPRCRGLWKPSTLDLILKIAREELGYEEDYDALGGIYTEINQGGTK